MMKVMLIFPPNVEVIEPFKSAKRKPPKLLWGFPLGIGYLGSVLRQKGFNVSILDSCFEGMHMDDIVNKVEEFKPAVVGIGCLTHILKTSVVLAKAIKKRDENIKVVFGGPHATYDYENLLKMNALDWVVIGEGENTFTELCEKIKNGQSVDNVKGIAFRDCDGNIKKTALRPLIEDLDNVPFPARDLVDFGKYIKSYGVLEKSVDIMSSRGCVNRCIFCSSSHLFGKWRTRSSQDIIAEISELVEKYPEIKSVNFMDDDFTANKQRVMELCNLLISTGLNRLNWVCLARGDQLDEEMVHSMKLAGCLRVHLGIESGSPEILKNINKRISLQQARSAVKLLSREKIEAFSFFMVGHPGETKQTIALTKRFAHELKSANTGFFISQVFPGTALARLQPIRDWVSYVYEPEINNPSIFTHPCIPNFIPAGFTRESLKKICAGITKQFIFLHFVRRAPLFLKKLIIEPKETFKYIMDVFFTK